MSVGIDIIELDRLIGIEDKIVDKILSINEIAIYKEKNKNKLQFLGGRWALKEAFIKAYDIEQLNLNNMKDIEVFNEINGKPYIIFKNKKYNDVSISHEKHYAVGMVNINL